MQARSLVPILGVLIPISSSGCFDPPELEAWGPPVADLGTATADTWPEPDEAGAVEDDEGPVPEPPPSDSASSSSAGVDTEDPIELDPALEQLRLTEVLADPDGKDGGAESPEIVEILNPGPAPVNLSGLTVMAASWPDLDADELGVSELELAVGGILIVQRFATDVDPAVVGVEVLDGAVWIGFQHSGGLRNTDGVVLLQAGALPIDQVEYGPDTGLEAPGSGQSLCRPEGPEDLWSVCMPSPGSLGSGDGPDDVEPDEPDPILPGELQIVEVAANPPGPASDEKAWEYVEIVNLSESPLELVGLRLGDDPSIAAPGLDPLVVVSGDGGCASPTCLAPGARAILVGEGYLGEVGSGLVLMTDDTTLADGGLTTTEPVALWGPDDALISSYRIWPDPAGDPLATEEQPLHRIDPLGPDEPSNWISAPATPGS